MQYRELGGTGIKVSEIGFGAWGIGGPSETQPAYGYTDDTESRKALYQSYIDGITFYDTADFYGQGHSEHLIGTALKDVRKEVVIATKVGLMDSAGRQDFSSQYIQTSLDSSLKRLRTDYIDLYQLHIPPIETLKNNDDLENTLRNLKNHGKVRAIGISLRSPNDGLQIINNPTFESIQVNFNLLDQRVLENNLLQVCEEKHIGIIVRTPLCFGFLTGEYKNQETFGTGDHRSSWSASQIETWASAYTKFADLKDQSNPTTPSQTALRYCLSYSAVSTVIPGMLTKDHVIENSAASEMGGFGKENRLLAEQIYNDNSFFLGSR